MPRRKQSQGRCAYCGTETAVGSMAAHLAACPERQTAIVQAKGGPVETLYQLHVQAAAKSEFWLDFEMRGSATLKQLDSYLRAIWLKCCGHLSRFSQGGWSDDSIPVSRRARQVLDIMPNLVHQYDFGETSETLIKVMGAREGKPMSRHAIALLARNLIPEEQCIVCQKAARWLCIECLIEDNRWGTLCDEHARVHPHDNYGEPIGLVNSPRMGMCGYTGPAEPPY